MLLQNLIKWLISPLQKKEELGNPNKVVNWHATAESTLSVQKVKANYSKNFLKNKCIASKEKTNVLIHKKLAHASTCEFYI